MKSSAHKLSTYGTALLLTCATCLHSAENSSRLTNWLAVRMPNAVRLHLHLCTRHTQINKQHNFILIVYSSHKHVRIPNANTLDYFMGGMIFESAVTSSRSSCTVHTHSEITSLLCIKKRREQSIFIFRSVSVTEQVSRAMLKSARAFALAYVHYVII